MVSYNAHPRLNECHFNQLHWPLHLGQKAFIFKFHLVGESLIKTLKEHLGLKNDAGDEWLTFEILNIKRKEQ